MAATQPPNPLVAALAKELPSHVRAVAAPAGPNPTDADFGNALAQAPIVPELVMFTGYLGGKITNRTAGVDTEWRQFFLDPSLSTWVLVPEKDIVKDDSQQDPIVPFGRRDFIWVKGDASTVRGTGAARYLQGEFTLARNFSESGTRGTFAPTDGVPGISPLCCGPKSRRAPS
jgi:hypothetical protein